MNFADEHQSVADHLNRDLFFVVGHFKSGLTWVERSLDAHAQIVCRGEAHLTDHVLPAVRSLAGQFNAEQANRARIQECEHVRAILDPRRDAPYLVAVVMARVLRNLCPDLGVVLGEKSPEHIRHLSLLGRVFPRARFVHVLRDGRDGAVSGWCHANAVAPEWVLEKFGTFTEYTRRFARRWVRSIQAAASFEQRFPRRLIHVRYEDLHEDPERALRQALGFLGMDRSTDVVHQCVEAGRFRVLSGGREPGEEDPFSFFRKGVVGDWRRVMPKESVDIFRAEAGPMLQRLGYPE